MYGFDLLVGAASLERLEQAVEGALTELDLVVAEGATVSDLAARYDFTRSAATRHGEPNEAPSIALWQVTSTPVFAIDVRAVRSPLWHLGFAQRVSRLLGSWAALRVNDRLFSDYARGFFFAGHVVEAGMRSHDKVVARYGGDPRANSPSALLESLAESANTLWFDARVESLARCTRAGLQDRDGPVRVLLVASKTGDPIDARSALPWLSDDRAPRVVGTLAGLRAEERDITARELRALGVQVETVDVDASYDVLADGSLDKEPRRILSMSARLPLRAQTILDTASRVACAGVVVEVGIRSASECLPAIDAWTRPLGGAFEQVEVRDASALSNAWKHVTTATGLPPMRWTFQDGGVRPRITDDR